MNHFAWIRRRLSRSVRVRIAMLVLSTIALPAVFAELIASPAPVVAYGAGGFVAFPTVFHPAAYPPGALEPDVIAAHHQGDLALWPIFRHGPSTISKAGAHAAPSGLHLLGTDGRGRDLFVRLIYGGRVALGIAVVSLVLAMLVGGLMGAVAGYFGGAWDELLARPIELVETFPSVFVVAVVRAAYPEGSLWSLALAVAAVRWAEVARLVRAEVVKTASADYVLAARALGCTHQRILLRHILPVALRPTLESSVFGIASVVILEVSVSFLGLGPDVSWGATIADSVTQGGAVGPALWAGAALVATVGAAFMLADAAGEALSARVATTRG